jgi:conjugative transfer signal peptidase TraF
VTGVAAPIALAGAALVLLALSEHDRRPRIVWNTSASVTVGLYAVRSLDRPRTGDLVAVRPPAKLADWFDAMGYLDRDVLLIKRIAAVPGAEICRRAHRILIDGSVVALAQARDSLGRQLPSWSGCRRLQGGEVFLLNADAPASLDGRYSGPTDASTIVGEARPLLTVDG